MTKLTSILFAVPLIASLGPMTIQPLLASAPSRPQVSWNNLGNLARGDVVKLLKESIFLDCAILNRHGIARML